MLKVPDACLRGLTGHAYYSPRPPPHPPTSPAMPLTTCTSSAQADIFKNLCHAHTHFKHLIGAWANEARLGAPATMGARLNDIGRHLIHDVSQHASFEALYIDPLLATVDASMQTEARASDGALLTALSSFQSSLDKVCTDTAPAIASFATLSPLLEADMKLEEDKVWPRLSAALPQERLMKLLDDYLATVPRGTLPTHPHPLAMSGSATEPGGWAWGLERVCTGCGGARLVAPRRHRSDTRLPHTLHPTPHPHTPTALTRLVIAPLLGIIDHAYDALAALPPKTSGSAITASASPLAPTTQ